MINFIQEMKADPSYKIFFIGESAATIDFGNIIDEKINSGVITLFNYLLNHPPEGMIDAIPAYSSLSIYFDFNLLRKKIPHQNRVCEWIKNELHSLMSKGVAGEATEKKLAQIPVCYENEFAVDLHSIARQKNITPQEVIRLHSSKQYRVYMLGFLPGFAYMGEVDEQIAVPRIREPRQISAGSVGIAGKQTGIYPLNSPGGWQIIGKTPLKMFDNNRIDPCLLRAGDHVKFYSITTDEFENYQGRAT